MSPTMLVVVALPLVLAGALFRYPAQALGLIGIGLMIVAGGMAIMAPMVVATVPAVILGVSGITFCGLAGVIQMIEHAIQNR